jgi:regulator of sigma E protease
VTRGGAADRAGLRLGDIVTAINGTPTTLVTRMNAIAGERPVSVTIVREGRAQTLAVSLGSDRVLGATAAIPTALFRPEPLDAFTLGARAILGSSAEILRTIAGLATGQISPTHLIGPVGLAQIAGESSQLGWRALLAAIAFISLNLGLCNLLPIPILDGGHMLMMVVEGVTRRDVPVRLRKALVGAGAVAMLLLLVTTFYNDLGRLGWLPL